eukprot:3914963-Pyramimonas_sp.AAC.1
MGTLRRSRREGTHWPDAKEAEEEASADLTDMRFATCTQAGTLGRNRQHAITISRIAGVVEGGGAHACTALPLLSCAPQDVRRR